MRLQKAPNNWSCLPTAFAIVIDIDVQEVIRILGHDGSEIVAPNNPEPYCRRGFHIQEIIEYCIPYYSLTPIQPIPIARYIDGSKIEIKFKESVEDRMQRIMSSSIGVITGTTINGQLHAVAWNGSMILDPNGTYYAVDKFRIDTYWMLQRASNFND